jgi:hypothetical protein
MNIDSFKTAERIIHLDDDLPSTPVKIEAGTSIFIHNHSPRV